MAARVFSVVAKDFVFYPGEPALFARQDRDIRKDLERRMVRVKLRARQKVRVRTGALFQTIRLQWGVQQRGQYVDVIAGKRGSVKKGGVRYVMIEEDGSKPHEIRARRRKYLRFVMNGQIVFRKRVFHPGTTGSKFLSKSLIVAAA